MNIKLPTASLSLVIALTITPSAFAGEGASINYFPGTYGDFAVAVAPNPGLTFINYNLFYDASADIALSQGDIHLDIDTFAYINMSTLLYSFEKSVFGAQFTMGDFFLLAMQILMPNYRTTKEG